MQRKIKNRNSGSFPQIGKIADNQLDIILDIPGATLRNWRSADNHKATMYWTLKAITKDELLEYKKDGVENGVDKISDKELQENLGIPMSTLVSWRKKESRRHDLYKTLKAMSIHKLISHIEDGEKIKKLAQEQNRV